MLILIEQHIKYAKQKNFYFRQLWLFYWRLEHTDLRSLNI